MKMELFFCVSGAIFVYIVIQCSITFHHIKPVDIIPPHNVIHVHLKKRG